MIKNGSLFYIYSLNLIIFYEESFLFLLVSCILIFIVKWIVVGTLFYTTIPSKPEENELYFLPDLDLYVRVERKTKANHCIIIGTNDSISLATNDYIDSYNNFGTEFFYNSDNKKDIYKLKSVFSEDDKIYKHDYHFIEYNPSDSLIIKILEEGSFVKFFTDEDFALYVKYPQKANFQKLIPVKK